MGCYVFAPAGPAKLHSDMLKKCIEFIGSKQVGGGSDYAKGRRYLKYKLQCSGRSIKRAVQSKPKLWVHDFETYGIDVYYYHVDYCAAILRETIDYINDCSDDVKEKLLGTVPGRNDYLDLLYKHRISQLKWVEIEDYEGQSAQATFVLGQFATI